MKTGPNACDHLTIEMPRLATLFLLFLVPACATPPQPAAQMALAAVHAESHAPAMAYAVASSAGLLDAGAHGVTRIRGNETVSPADAFHIGSVTKPLTATLAARLVTSGQVSWQTRIAELFTVPASSPYAAVTLEQLLAHEAGLPAYTDDPFFLAIPEFSGSRVEQRVAFIDWLVQQPPVATPGEGFSYSNAGYAVAAAMLERASGSSWETLLREQVFEPLQMTTAGFGWPPRVHGHEPHAGKLVAVAREDSRLPQVLASAGDVHASVRDMATFAASWLRSLRGEDGIVATRQAAFMLSPRHSGGIGWGVETAGAVGDVAFHIGSAGTFVMVVALLPDTDRAFIVTANAGTVAAEEDCLALLRRLVRIHTTP